MKNLNQFLAKNQISWSMIIGVTIIVLCVVGALYIATVQGTINNLSR